MQVLVYAMQVLALRERIEIGIFQPHVFSATPGLSYSLLFPPRERRPARTEPRSAMKLKQKNVLIALGWNDHRLIQGIAAYATQHRWHLAANSIIHEKVIPWGWQGDGVLAWLA